MIIRSGSFRETGNISLCQIASEDSPWLGIPLSFSLQVSEDYCWLGVPLFPSKRLKTIIDQKSIAIESGRKKSSITTRVYVNAFIMGNVLREARTSMTRWVLRHLDESFLPSVPSKSLFFPKICFLRQVLLDRPPGVIFSSHDSQGF